ncbi:major facilitator superfamily domain-containing protein [Parasitella parasitica]|nr:major facilitator superfamily domain-containing protein [Parasitella parasitica]
MHEKSSSFASKDEFQTDEQVPFAKSEAENKFVRKMNIRFIPFVCLILFLQFIDKSTLSIVAIIPEFFADTGINRDQYAWCNSIFYLGYLCMQLPNNFMMQKFPISKYIGIMLLLWGAVLFCMCFAHNFGQLAGLRFLLGFFESTTYPCIFLLIATMYRRSEQVVWFGIMFVSNNLSTVIGNSAAVGILKMPTVGFFSPWKWALVIYGSLTMAAGVVYFFFMPDRPDSRWFNLTEEEKLIVEDRARDNAVVPNRKIKMDQIIEALKEPRLYCYCLISMFVNFQNGALTSFNTLIISDLGFSSTETILLAMPYAVVIVIMIFITTYLSKRYSEVIYVAMGACVMSIVGLTLLIAIPSGGVKLMGIYLSGGCTPSYVLLQASIASNVSGYTKKIFYTAGNLVFYTIGNFVGPLLLRDKEAPRYFTGMAVYIAANVLSIILFAYVRTVYVQANKRRHLDKNVNIAALPDGLEDITDVQNEHFVYRT